MIDRVLLMLFVGGTFLTMGDIWAKKWMLLSDGKFSISTGYYILSLLFYGVGLTLFAFSLKHKNLAVATVIIIFFNILTVLIAGYFLFDEKFSMLKIFGILVGFISVVILEIAG